VNLSAGHHGATGRFQKLRDAALEQAFFLSLAGMAPAMPEVAARTASGENTAAPKP
jgi:hypothetical protein